MKKYLLSILAAAVFATASAQHKVSIRFKDGRQTIVTDASNILSISIDPNAHDLVQVQAVADKTTYTTAHVNVTVAGDYSGTSKIGLKWADTEEGLDAADCRKTELNGAFSTLGFSVESLAPATRYYYVAYVVYGDETISTDVQTFDTQSSRYPVAEAVDLGLSVKWASWNMGATEPSEDGCYIGWGNIDETHYTASVPKLSEQAPTYNFAGDARYDMATAEWGKGWCTPTVAQCQELANLNWVYSASYLGTGRAGWVITAENGNSIFLPSSGWMNNTNTHKDGTTWMYWTSELRYNATLGQRAMYAAFYAGNGVVGSGAEMTGVYMPLRPVFVESGSEPDVPADDESDEAGKAVDLGLSVRWADRNVGAASAADYGEYFAWGETKAKDDYSPANYEGGQITDDAIGGTEYDVARNRWKGAWRMPSKKEMDELIEKCDWTWTYQNAVPGYLVKSKRDASKSIFLPAAGYKYGTSISREGSAGFYWTDYIYVQRSDRAFAETLEFDESSMDHTYNTCAYGLTIRPVKP